MSDQVTIPDFAVYRVGALTLQLAAAEERVRDLERQLAELQKPIDENAK